MNGEFKSGGSSGYWRLVSGCSSRAGGCKAVGWGVDGALGAELVALPDWGGGEGRLRVLVLVPLCPLLCA